MKKQKYLIYLVLLVFLGFSTSSCSKKTGCKATENISSMPSTNKKGMFKKRKTKSRLFK